MKDNLKILELDKYEQGIIINALTELRNMLIQQQRDIEDVNLLILKTLDAPERKRYFHKDRYCNSR